MLTSYEPFSGTVIANNGERRLEGRGFTESRVAFPCPAQDSHGFERATNGVDTCASHMVPVLLISLNLADHMK